MKSLLFSQGDLFTLLEVQKQKLMSEIQNLAENAFNPASIGQLTDSLRQKYWLIAPMLKIEEKYALVPKSIKVSGRGYYGETGQYDGIETTIVIPFEGEASLFLFRGSAYTSATPHGEIHGDEMHLIYERSSNWDVGQEAKRDIDNIEAWLSGIRADVDKFNAELPKIISEAVERKKRKMAELQAHVTRLGMPVKSNAQDPDKNESQQPPDEPIAKRKNSIAKREVFLCHAGEDKENYVRPFASELEESKITYWLDEAEIIWGDSLIGKINEGLKISTYVIVFLSNNFLNKNWPKKELEAALGKENRTGQTIVLPLILDNVEEILASYPILEGKIYLSWKVGFASIIAALEKRLGRK